MSTDAQHIDRRMAKGAAWMIMLRFAVRAIAFVQTLILARLLVPEDFGIVALATVVWHLIDAFGEFNFEIPLIRQRNATRKHYDTVWTLNLAKGFATACILAAVASPVAGFYEEPRLTLVLLVLAPAAFIRGFENSGVVDFRKELMFDKEFRYLLGQRVGVTIVTLTLAFLWRDYWALVAGLVAQAPIRVGLSYLVHSFRPRPSLAAAREYFGFSKWLLVANLANFGGIAADRLILGKLLGPAPVAIYMIALEISTLATAEMAGPIQRAVLPGYAKLADNTARLVESFVRSYHMMVALILPATVGIYLIADIAIPVLLGDKWLDAIPIVGILAIFGLIKILGVINRPAFLAVGRARLTAGLAVFGLAFMIPGIYLGAVHGGLVGAAWGATGAIAIRTSVSVTLVLHLLRIHPFRIVRATWRSGLATVVMAGAVLGLKEAWPVSPDTGVLLGQFLSAVAVGAVVYVASHLCVWRLAGKPEGIEGHAIVLIRRVGAKIKSRVRPIAPEVPAED